jgi:hypothetical protein
MTVQKTTTRVKKELTQRELKKLLHYSPETGALTWKKKVSQRTSVGDIAGSLCNGYTRISIDGCDYLAHRLAWLYVYGAFPTKELDHINRVRNDNRISNLREVSSSENSRNRTLNKNNSSGYPGVRWNKQMARWVARINIKNKRIHLGSFIKKEDAVFARNKAEDELSF